MKKKHKVETKRERLSNEIMHNIRYIKQNGLENMYLDKLNEMKSKEREFRNAEINMNQGFSAFDRIHPQITYVVSLYFFFYYKKEFKIEELIVFLGVFDHVKGLLNFVPHLLNWYFHDYEGMKKMNNFLISEEIDLNEINWNKGSEIEKDENAIVVSNANYYWEDKQHNNFVEEKKALEKYFEKDKRFFKCVKSKSNRERLLKQIAIDKEEEKKKKEEEKRKKEEEEETSPLIKENSKENDSKTSAPTSEENEKESEDKEKKEEEKEDPEKNKIILKDISFNIKRGQLIAIIGKIGSGKTSLLNSLFGELYKEKSDSKIKLNGRISLVTQKPWIRSLTIKQNILFNTEYNEERYQQALKYSELLDDLKILPEGDQSL